MKSYGYREVREWHLSHATGISRDTRSRSNGGHIRLGPPMERWAAPARLRLFESWLELRTHPIFQLHNFTEQFIGILEKSLYGTSAKTVKAVLVEALADRGTASEKVLSTAISLKVPKGDGINSGRGLVVHERPEIKNLKEALELEIFGVPLETKVRMNIRNKVMSITERHVRLCPSDTLIYSYAWGEFDRRYPDGYLHKTPDTDLEALSSLTF